MEERLLRMKDLTELVPICRAKIYQLIREKKFPAPRKIGKTSVWKKSEIIKYIQKI